MFSAGRPVVPWIAFACLCGVRAHAQDLPGVQSPQRNGRLPPPPPGYSVEPFNFQPPSPETLEMIKLEERFAADVEKGGGPAFARWFADDGVTLGDGEPPIIGRAAIERSATWRPDRYKLSWFVEGAGIAPSHDAAYTWGHYDSETAAATATGKPITRSGRYITFWKRIDGQWKVSLEASAEEPAGAASIPLGTPGPAPGGVRNAPQP